MERIYLDCSGLHNIILNVEGVPSSIYVDGQDFINRLEQTLLQAQYVSPEDKKEKQRWELIVALAGNPEMVKGKVVMGCGVVKPDGVITAEAIINQADIILEIMDKK